jgi:GNAT superfamily N-acetyltransferase
MDRRDGADRRSHRRLHRGRRFGTRPTGRAPALVLVDEAFHGRGIGKQLLERALSFCRQAGYHSVFLWIVEGLPRSFVLYERAGFRVVERTPDGRYGLPRVHLELGMALA